MSANKFKAGELVQLKAGGPKMVIDEVSSGYGSDSTTYYCTWFSGAKHNKNGFHEEAIQPYSEDDE